MVISTEQAPSPRRKRAGAGPLPIEPTPASATEAAPGAVGAEAAVAAPQMLPVSDRTLVFASLAVVVLGFSLLAITWGQVAGEANVARQLPYLVSGGLTGLALVVVGTALGVVAGWRAERQADQFELERVCALVRELTDSLQSQGR